MGLSFGSLCSCYFLGMCCVFTFSPGDAISFYSPFPDDGVGRAWVLWYAGVWLSCGCCGSVHVCWILCACGAVWITGRESCVTSFSRFERWVLEVRRVKMLAVDLGGIVSLASARCLVARLSSSDCRLMASFISWVYCCF